MLPPPPIGFALWTIVNLLAALHLARRAGQLSRQADRLWVVLLLLTSFPILQNLVSGQPMILAACAVGEGYLALRAGRDFRAGLWLGLLAFRPQYAILWGLLLVWKRRWAAVEGAAIGTAAVLSGSVLIGGVSALQSYPAALIEAADFDGDPTRTLTGEMINWQSLILFFVPDIADPSFILLSLLLSALSVACLALAWRGPWAPRGRLFPAKVSLVLVATLLATSPSHLPDAVLLALPLAAVLAAERPSRLTRVTVAAAVLLPMLMLARAYLSPGSLPIAPLFALLLVICFGSLLLEVWSPEDAVAAVNSRRPRPQPTASSSGDPRAPPEREGGWLGERLAMVAAANVLLWYGRQMQLSSQLPAHPEFALISFVSYLTAFAMLGYAVLAKPVDPSARRAFLCLTLAALLASFVAAVAAEMLFANPIYGTDVLALSHLAAERLLAGHNPYTFDVQPDDLARFGVPNSAITQTTFGEIIGNPVSYPSLSFLLFVPSLWIGVPDLRWTTLLFQVASIALVALIAPWRWKVLAVIAILANIELALYFTAGSLTDWIWVLPCLLMLACLYRSRFGYGAVCFGLAASIKQQPWFLAPFLLIWLYQNVSGHTARRLLRVARFGSIAAGVFLAINAPFIVLDPTSWLRNVMAPITEPMIPHGQGMSLLTQLRMISAPKVFYTAAAISVLVIVSTAYAMYYDHAPSAAWILPAFVLWFNYRSYQNYYLYWIPIVLLALLLEERRRCGSERR